MIKSILIGLIGLFITIAILHIAKGIHLPLLPIMIMAFAIGFTNPRKGWLIIIGLILALLAYGFYFQKFNLKPENPSLIQFICKLAAIPLLFGGYMGRYFSKIF